MKTGSDGRAVLDAAARSRHAGVPTSALLNLTKGNDSAQKVAYQVKTLVAAGLVRKREALLDGERREKTSVHYLRRFAPAPDFNASVDAEGEQSLRQLLNRFEEIAVSVVQKDHNGVPQLPEAVQDEWRQNAMQIAVFLTFSNR